MVKKKQCVREDISAIFLRVKIKIGNSEKARVNDTLCPCNLLASEETSGQVNDKA